MDVVKYDAADAGVTHMVAVRPTFYRIQVTSDVNHVAVGYQVIVDGVVSIIGPVVDTDFVKPVFPPAEVRPPFALGAFHNFRIAGFGGLSL